jgi:Ca2+-binding EF-hand superfamily protein
MKLTNLRPSFFSKDKSKKNNKSRQYSISQLDNPLSFGSTDSTASSSDGSTSVHDQPISKQELEAILRCLDVTEDEVEVMLAESSAGYDIVKITKPADETELKDAFGVFDTDGDGRISAEELHEMLAMLGDEHCSLDDCRRMVRLVDRVGDGFVCFSDFVRMMDGAWR